MDEKELIIEYEVGQYECKLTDDSIHISQSYDGGMGSPPGFSWIVMNKEAAIEMAEFILKNYKGSNDE